MIVKTGANPIRKTKTLRPKAPAKPTFEQPLIDNFVNLQKVLTNLVIKFDNLSDQISKLLQLFEISAKSFAEKQSEESSEQGGNSDKIDLLLEQNKTIAKGILLIEEKMRNKSFPELQEQKSRLVGFK